jgi:poly(A) polymerase
LIAKAALQRLRDASWLKGPETQRLFALLDGSRRKTRAVGGSVRDTLLGRAATSTDLDLATEFTPDEVMARAAAAKIAAYPTGIGHGTVTLKLGDTTAEVTTLREDIDTDGRHATVRFGRDWLRDAERRDFTLNALYADANGQLFDPLGGAEDCLSGHIRFIGDADQRIAEDRLRVYRFFRFSASHGIEQFDATGLAAATRAASSLGGLSAERIGMEMRKLLGLPKVAKTLRTMSEARVLELDEPDLARFAAYERHARRPDLAARLALMVSARGTAVVRDAWRLSNDEVSTAEAILAAAALLVDFEINEAAYRFPAAIADAVEVSAVLAGWTEAGKSAVLDELQGIDVPRFPIKGDDLMEAGIKPGKAMGTELDRLERVWIGSGFSLTRDQLLAQVRR